MRAAIRAGSWPSAARAPCSTKCTGSADQLRDHPLRGAIFETWVASEILKSRLHRGLPPSLSFFRDRKGTEVDVIIEDGRALLAVETKSGQTIAGDFFAGLESFMAMAAASQPPRKPKSFLVYGGAETQKRSIAEVVSWSHLDRCRWWEAEGSRGG